MRFCTKFLAVFGILSISLALFVASAVAAEVVPDAATETPDIVQGDAAGPTNAAVAEDVDSAWVTANEDLRDEQGRALDPEPELGLIATPYGSVLGPDEDPANYGVVGTPTGSSVTAVLGDSIFSTFVIRLVGRDAVVPRLDDGAASYDGAAPGGGDIETTLRAGALEEWIVVSDVSQLRTFRYLVTATGNVSITALDESTLLAETATSSMTISAPLAYDEAGNEYSPRLTPVANGFDLTVPGAEDATFPLYIDPLFATNDETTDGTNTYTGVHCGDRSEDTGDSSSENAVPPEHRTATCTSPNMSGLLFSGSSDAAYDAFPNEIDAGGIDHGISVGVKTNVTPGNNSNGWIEFRAPDGAGIWSAYLRGHVTSTNRIQCEMSYTGVDDLSLVDKPDVWPTQTGHYGPARRGGDPRLFAGDPQGGGDAWATFPMTSSLYGPGYLGLPNPDRRTHMVGFFAMANPNALSEHMANTVRLSAWENTNNEAQARGHRCRLDGIARIALHDGEPPSVQMGTGTGAGRYRAVPAHPGVVDPADPSSPKREDPVSFGDVVAPHQPTDEVAIADAQLGAPFDAHHWLRPATVVSSDSPGHSLRSVDYQDRQSGLRSAELRLGRTPSEPAPAGLAGDFRRIPGGVLRPCSGTAEATDTNPNPEDGQLGLEERWNNTTGNGSRPGPCPTDIPNLQPGDLAAGQLFQSSDLTPGRHGVAVRSTDFVFRRTQVNPAPLNPTGGPNGSQRGWYWVDAHPPTCTKLVASGPSIRNATVTINAHDPGAIADAAGRFHAGNVNEAFRLGSGLKQARVYINGVAYGTYAVAANAAFELTIPNVDLEAGASNLGGRNRAAVVVELVDRTEDDVQNNRRINANGSMGNENGAPLPAIVHSVMPIYHNAGIAYPPLSPVSATNVGSDNPCAIAMDLGHVDVTPPSCDEQSGSVHSIGAAPNDPSAIVLSKLRLPDGSNAPGTNVRVYFSDPGYLDADADGWDDGPPPASGVKVVRLRLNTHVAGRGNTPFSHVKVLTVQERNQGYVDFPAIDIYEGVATANNGSAPVVVNGNIFFLSDTDVTIEAQVEDRTVLLDQPAPAHGHITQGTADPATQATQDAGCLFEKTFGPPVEMEVEAVRGAHEVVGVWGDALDQFGDHYHGYVWSCTLGTDPDQPIETVVPWTSFPWQSADSDRFKQVVQPTTGPTYQNRGSDIPDGVYANTGPCHKYVDEIGRTPLWIHARSQKWQILGPIGRDSDTVDQRPEAQVAPTHTRTIDEHRWYDYEWMSENGIDRDFGTTRDSIPVIIRDLDTPSNPFAGEVSHPFDDDLFAGSDPDERILGMDVDPDTDEHARVLLTLGDHVDTDAATAQRADYRVYVTIELSENDDDIKYRLSTGTTPPANEASTPITVTPGDNADDTCVRGGGDDNVIRTDYWVLRCNLIPDRAVCSDEAVPDNEHPRGVQCSTEGDIEGEGNRWSRLDLPLVPREYGEPWGALGLGETPPTGGVHNVDKPTLDRWTYESVVQVRDRRQRADNHYLTLESSPNGMTPPTPPFAEEDRPLLSDHVDMHRTTKPARGVTNPVVIDRVLPTIATTIEDVENQEQIPLTVQVADPQPSGTTDPKQLNASGLRYVRAVILPPGTVPNGGTLDMVEDDVIGISDHRVFPPHACANQSFPLPEDPDKDHERTSSATCEWQIPAPSPDAPGKYVIRTQVRDMATNHADQDLIFHVPAQPVAKAVRGAGGVAAHWPSVDGAVAYRYRCRVAGVLQPEHFAVENSTGHWRTMLCKGKPGELVQIEIVPINEFDFEGTRITVDETIDRRTRWSDRTSSTTGVGKLGSAGGYWEASFNGRTFAPDGTQHPYLTIDITDPDDNLLDDLPAEHHLSDLIERPEPDCTTLAAGNLDACTTRPRAVVTLRPDGRFPLADPGGTFPELDERDQPESLQVLVQLSDDPAEQLVRFYDDSRDPDAWTRPMNVTDSDTCSKAEGVTITSAPGGYWTLDCSKLEFIFFNTTPFDIALDTLRMQLPLEPRDQGTSPHFTTPDQRYRVEVLARDQRQPADFRFLAGISEPPAGDPPIVDPAAPEAQPDADPIMPDGFVDNVGGLWLDRIVPEFHAAAATLQNTPGDQHHVISATVEDPMRPSDDPEELYQSGIHRVHLVGGLLDPVTNTVPDPIIDALLTCTPAPVPADAPERSCARRTPTLETQGMYQYTLTVYDHVGNHTTTTFDELFVIAPPQPELVTARGTSGVGAHWVEYPGATYTWTCALQNGTVIDFGTSLPSNVTGYQRTEECHAPPGTRVNFTVIGTNAGGSSAPGTGSETVDRHPKLYGTEQGPDHTGLGVVRYRTDNGHSSAPIRVAIRDEDQELQNHRPPSPHWLTPLPAASDESPRSVIAIEPPAGRPHDTSAYVIVQYGTEASGKRLVKIVDDSATGSLESMPLNAADTSSTCAPGDPFSISTQHWTIDCTDLVYDVPILLSGMVVLATLPIEPTSATPDQTYSVTGWGRDSRQELDYLYRSTNDPSAPDQPYASAAKRDLGKLVVDRIRPVASFAVPINVAPNIVSGPFALDVTNVHDVVPAIGEPFVTFDATGLNRVTVTLEEPDGDTPLLDFVMSCAPTPPLTAGNATDCTRPYTPTKYGDHTVTVRVFDNVGNHRQYDETFRFVRAPKNPVDPILVRGAQGVVAKWLHDPTDPHIEGYKWTCRNGIQPANTEQTGSFQLNSSPVNHYSAPNGDDWYYTDVCHGNPADGVPYGDEITVQVWATNVVGQSPDWTPETERVDRRPSASEAPASFDPDVQHQPTANSRNGTDYDDPNLVFDRDLTVALNDQDGDLLTLSAPDPVLGALQPSPAVPAGDRARTIFRVSPADIGRPLSDQFHVVVQLGPAGPGRMVRIVQGPAPTAPADDLNTVALNAAHSDTCVIGGGETITNAQWTLDCDQVEIAATGTIVHVRVPVRQQNGAGSYVTPDQLYTVRQHTRDHRQPADNLFLTGRGQNPPAPTDRVYLTQIAERSSEWILDHVVPTGTVSLKSKTAVWPTANVRLDVTATDPMPGSGTNPSDYDLSGLDKVQIRYQRLDNATPTPNPVGLPSNFTANDVVCTPSLPSQGQVIPATACEILVEGLALDTNYRFEVRAIDRARNHDEFSTGVIRTPNPPPYPVTITDVVRGAEGVVAKFVPDAGLNPGNTLGFNWRCVNVTDSTIQTGSQLWGKNIIGTGPARYVDICDGLSNDPYGDEIHVTIWPYNLDGRGPSNLGNGSQEVDARPAMTLMPRPLGHIELIQPWANSINGTEWRNVPLGDYTRFQRDLTFRISDRNGDLLTESAPDADLASLHVSPAPAGDRARGIIRIEPTAPGRPAGERLHLLLQFGPNNGERMLRAFEGDIPAGTDLNTLALTMPANPDPTDTICDPGTVDVITLALWTIDCAALDIGATNGSVANIRIPLRQRVVPTPSGILERFPATDQTYTITGYSRDHRQPADNEFLTGVGHDRAYEQQDEDVETKFVLDHVVPRVDDTPSVSVQMPANYPIAKPSASMFFTVTDRTPPVEEDAVDHDSPLAQKRVASGLSKVEVRVERIEGLDRTILRNYTTSGVTCAPDPDAEPLVDQPEVNLTSNCTFDSAPFPYEYNTSYVLRIRVTDRARNTSELPSYPFMIPGGDGPILEWTKTADTPTVQQGKDVQFIWRNVGGAYNRMICQVDGPGAGDEQDLSDGAGHCTETLDLVLQYEGWHTITVAAFNDATGASSTIEYTWYATFAPGLKLDVFAQGTNTSIANQQTTSQFADIELTAESAFLTNPTCVLKYPDGTMHPRPCVFGPGSRDHLGPLTQLGTYEYQVTAHNVAGSSSAFVRWRIVDVYRCYAPGELDPEFATQGTRWSDLADPIGTDEGVTQDAQHRIYTAHTGNLETVVTRMSRAGVPDPTFGTNGVVTLPNQAGSPSAGIALDSQGRVVVATTEVSEPTGPDTRDGVLQLRRLLSDGAVDTSFGSNGVLTIDTVQVDDVENIRRKAPARNFDLVIDPTSDALYAGYHLRLPNGDRRVRIYRIAGGSVDSTWGSSAAQPWIQSTHDVFNSADLLGGLAFDAAHDELVAAYAGGEQSRLVRYDIQGGMLHQNVLSLPGGGDVDTVSVALDGSGAAYVALGIPQLQAVTGPPVLGYVAKFTSAHQLVGSYGTNGFAPLAHTWPMAIAVDGGENAVVTGVEHRLGQVMTATFVTDAGGSDTDFGRDGTFVSHDRTIPGNVYVLNDGAYFLSAFDSDRPAGAGMGAMDQVLCGSNQGVAVPAAAPQIQWVAKMASPQVTPAAHFEWENTGSAFDQVTCTLNGTNLAPQLDGCPEVMDLEIEESGTYVLALRATDSESGTTSRLSHRWDVELDDGAPLLEWVSTPTDPQLGPTGSFEWRNVGGDFDQITCLLDGATDLATAPNVCPTQLEVTIAEAGLHTVTIVATDSSTGESSNLTFSWNVQPSAPNAAALYVGDRDASDADVVAQFTIGEGGALAAATPAFAAEGGTLSSRKLLVVSPDGKSLYASDGANRVYQYDLDSSGRATAKSPASEVAWNCTSCTANAMAISPDGTQLVMGDGAEFLHFFTIDVEGRLTARAPTPVEASSANDRIVALHYATPELALIVTNPDIPGAPYQVWRKVVTSNGTWTNSSFGFATQGFPYGGALESVAMHPTNGRLYVAQTKGILGYNVIDPTPSTVYSTSRVLPFPVAVADHRIVISPDGNDLYSAVGANIQHVPVAADGSMSAGATVAGTITGSYRDLDVTTDGSALFALSVENGTCVVDRFTRDATGALAHASTTTTGGIDCADMVIRPGITGGASDPEPPALEWTSTPADPSSDVAASFTWDSVGGAYDQITCTLDGQSVSPEDCPTNYITVYASGEGEHTVRVTATNSTTDASSTLEFTWTVLFHPDLALRALDPDGGVVSDSTPFGDTVVRLTSRSSTHDELDCFLNEEWRACVLGGSDSVGPLAPGTYTYRAHASNGSGASDVSTTWTVVEPRTSCAYPGDLDPTFSGDGSYETNAGNAGASSTPEGLVQDSSGRIITTHMVMDNATGNSSIWIWRFLEDGSPDVSFGTGGLAKVNVDNVYQGYTPSVVISDDDRLLLPFMKTRYDASLDSYVQQLSLTAVNEDGSIDSGFGVGGIRGLEESVQFGGIVDMVADPTGGAFLQVLTLDGHVRVYRLGTDWFLDSGWGAGAGTPYVESTERMQSSGLVVDTAGSVRFVAYSGEQLERFGVVRASQGDTAFTMIESPVLDLSQNGFSYLDAVSDGATGTYVSASDGYSSGTLLHLDSDGALDTSFGDGGYAPMYQIAPYGDLAVDSTGRIIVTGFSTSAYDMATQRLLSSGSVDDSFGNGTGVVEGPYASYPGSVIVLRDGRYVVAMNRAVGDTAFRIDVLCAEIGPEGPPEIEWTSTPTDPSADRTPDFEWQNVGGPFDEVNCTLDGNDISELTDGCATSFSIDVTEGPHTVEVTVRDTALDVESTITHQWTTVEPVPDVVDATTPAAITVELSGTGLDAPGTHWRLIDDQDFDSRYYDSAGPDAGLNPPGATVTIVDGTLVRIEDPAFESITITYVQTRDAGSQVVDEWYGTIGPIAVPLTFPAIERICSPAPNTIRFEGQRFVTATAGSVGYVITRLADYSINGLGGQAMQYEFADGSPDPEYDWVLIAHTDTVIEISNPRFSSLEPSSGPGDFVVTGAAFHSPDTLNMYYYEPWAGTFSTPVDGSGC